MAYLLDADVFIRAKRDHYRFDVCPGFWDWLVLANGAGTVFSVQRVQDELTAGTDPLAQWASGQTSAFFLPAEGDVVNALALVSTWVNAHPAYEAQAVQAFLAGADYWLIAHALAKAWTVVTHEKSEPMSKRRVKIPDVCFGLGVGWTNPFQMLEDEGAAFVL